MKKPCQTRVNRDLKTHQKPETSINKALRYFPPQKNLNNCEDVKRRFEAAKTFFCLDLFLDCDQELDILSEEADFNDLLQAHLESEYKLDKFFRSSDFLELRALYESGKMGTWGIGASNE